MISCTLLYGSLALGEDVPDREKGMASGQAVRIADADLKEDLVSLIEDHGRLSSAFKDEAQTLRARLREVDETVVWTDDERKQMIAILKVYKGAADSLYTGKVNRLLLRMGDSESITNAVQTMSEGSPVQRLKVPEELARSKQPAVVTALATDLLVDEPVRPQLVGGDIRVTPRSVSAMHIMNQILVESELFPTEVNVWARSLSAVKIGKRRELLRSWWNVNQEAMLNGDYMNTRPLSDAEQSLQATDLKPQRRPVRRID